MVDISEVLGKALGVETVKITTAPAPRFMCAAGGPSLATLYMGHYARMQAVIAAARAGDPLLIRLAVEHHDKHGSGE